MINYSVSVEGRGNCRQSALSGLISQPILTQGDALIVIHIYFSSGWLFYRFERPPCLSIV